MSQCPCGSGSNYNDCCEVFISGKSPAPTAEKLMRSRYSAYVKVECDYILSTTHPDNRADIDMEEMKSWAEGSDWKGLEILGTNKGQANDTGGRVEFVANYDVDGTPQKHHEVADFSKVDDNWVFVDGQIIRGTLVRTGPKVGRNDPCSCGSGKKFKKCCG